jgi:hypothetical protein
MRDNDEKIRYKIAEFLRKHCPALDFRESGSPYGRSGSVWHGCSCNISNSPCTCVWHETNQCEQGVWKMPFLNEERQKIQRKQEEMKNCMADVPKGIFTPIEKN